MRFERFASLLFLTFTVSTAAACSSSSDGATNASGSVETPTTNGVNDVMLACQARAPWTRTSASSCNSCYGLSTAPRCACTDQDYAGSCSDQATKKNNEPTCTGVTACVAKCALTDCACIDACYANVPACRAAASAEDGCVAAICDQYCK